MSTTRLLRESLELTLSKDDTFPARFYDVLFERHPEVRAMFHRSTPGAQRKMFAQKLMSIIDAFEEPAKLAREAAAVGGSHENYGVTPEMYAWVGEALIQTLAEACGDAWTVEAERARREAYAKLADAVLADK